MSLEQHMLEFGRHGDDVRRLQTKLALLGYDIPEGERLEGSFGSGTHQAVSRFQDASHLPVSGILDSHTSMLVERAYAMVRPRTIKAQITHVDNKPALNIRVRLFQKRLTNHLEIASGDTNNDGMVLFVYTASQCAVSELEHVALWVEVPDAATATLLQSTIIYAPGVEETIEVRLASAAPLTSERTHIAELLAPLLDGVDPATLDTDQITHLIRISGIDHSDITHFVAGARLAHAQNLPEEFAFLIHRAQLIAPGSQLLDTSQVDLLAAIDTALGEGHLNNEIALQLQTFTRESLADRQVQHLLHISDDDQPPSLGKLLTTIPDRFELQPTTAATFARTIIEKGSEADDLWQRVADAGVPPEDVATLGLTFAIRDLTQSHTPLLQELHARRNDASQTSLAYLATVKPAEWLDLGYTHGAAPGSVLTPGEYVQAIEAGLEALYPTQVFAERLRQGELRLTGLPVLELLNFLDTHGDFDLTTSQIEPYLADHDLQDSELKPSLMRIQRARVLAGNWRGAGILLEKHLDSAGQIVRRSMSDIESLVGVAVPGGWVRTMYAHAQDTTLATQLIATQYSSRYTTMPSVFAPTNDERTLVRYPNLRSLFGDLDFCECRHCRSVLGPAAYIVDLLQFLEHTNAKQGGSVLDWLLLRRPDIVDLDLSCQNTNTEMPYIDLVLEFLENAAVLPLDITPSPRIDIATEFSQGSLPAPVMVGLRRTAMTIGKTLRVDQTDQPTDWYVSDGSRRWTLRYRQRQLLYTSVTGSWLRLPIQLQDIDAAVQALDGGNLDSQLVDVLAPEQHLPLFGSATVTKQSDTKWRVEYVRGVIIKVLVANPYGSVELLALDGQPIAAPQQQGLAYLQRLVADLQSGEPRRIANVLALYGLPVLDYNIVFDAINRQWEFRYAGDASFWLQPEQLTIEALTYQNSSVQTDLLAYPENRDPEAYIMLENAVFPWALPFSLWLEECRAYLDNLGVPRLKLMELLRPFERWRAQKNAIEALGFSQAEAELIAPAQPATGRWRYWGLDQYSNQLDDHSSGEAISGGWLQVLRRMSILLQQSGLSQRELLNLLQTDYLQDINPQLVIASQSGSVSECRPSQLTIENLNGDHLDRIHRFVRLWRKLGWSMPEVDRAIRFFGPNNSQDIRPATLRTISLLHRLCDHLRASPRIALTWFTGFDTKPVIDHTREGSPQLLSLYAEVFLRPALHNPTDPDFGLDSAGTELAYLASATAPKKLSDKASLIGAALGIRPADVVFLVQNSNGHIADELTIANLWAVLRVAGLVRAMRLSVEQYQRLITITGIDPFHPQARTMTNELRVTQVHHFIEMVDFIRTSEFNLDELEYLLFHAIATNSAFAQIEQEHARFLGELRIFFQNGDVLSDLTTENLARQLGRLDREHGRPGWPERLVALAIGSEGLAYDPEAFVDVAKVGLALPLQIPADIQHLFSYDDAGSTATEIRVWCRGVTKPTDFDRLETVLPAPPTGRSSARRLEEKYAEAVDDAATLLAGRMRSFSLPLPFRQAAAVQPPESLTIDDEFAWRMFYDFDTDELVWAGWMSIDERDKLKQRFPNWQQSLDDLYTQIKDFRPAPSDTFLDKTEAKRLLTMPVLEDRLRVVLLRMLPHLEQPAVIARLSTFLGLEAAVVETLGVAIKDTAGTSTALLSFMEASFMRSDPTVPVTTNNAAAQFAALTRFQKAALLVQKLELHLNEIGWLVRQDLEMLTLPMLPVAYSSDTLFEDWRHLLALVQLRNALLGGGATIDRLLNTLADPVRDNFHQILANALAIPLVEVDAATAAEAINLGWPGSYRQPRRLLELVELLQVIKGMGISTQTAVLLTISEPTPPTPVRNQRVEISLAARHILQAHFDAESLSKRLKPVSDRLRDLQRNALVQYLVAKNRLRDAEALFDHLLIDVQMGACMRTSRLVTL